MANSKGKFDPAASRHKDANYDGVQSSPRNRMGKNSFAGMPEEVIMQEYAGPVHRDGIVNSYSCSVSELSGIDENERRRKGRY